MSEPHSSRSLAAHATMAGPWPRTADGGWDFAAPLDTATGGRLDFVPGASRVTIVGEAAMADLCRARFEGEAPDVRAAAGVVTLRYPRHSLGGLVRDLLRRDSDAATIALNGTIPWHVETAGGASRLTADLRALRLQRFRIVGGASRVMLTLPRPSGVVPIRIDGGASHLTIHRPAGVAARLRIRSGASGLTVDGQAMGAVGGEVRWQSPDDAIAADRYEIEIAGGATDLTVAAPA